MKSAVVSFLVVCAMSASAAEAAPIIFALGGTFDSGSIFTGTLVIDTTTGAATSVVADISAPAAVSFTMVEAQALVAPNLYQLQIGNGAGLPDLNLVFPVSGSDLTGYAGGPFGAGSVLSYSIDQVDPLTGYSSPVQFSALAAQVPEPGVLALFGLGLGGVVRRRNAFRRS